LLGALSAAKGQLGAAATTAMPGEQETRLVNVLVKGVGEYTRGRTESALLRLPVRARCCAARGRVSQH